MEVRVDCVDPVTVDHPDYGRRRAIAQISAWRRADGFDCYASLGGKIYHGVSADGTWIVLDRYPVVSSGVRPCAVLTDDGFVVFYVEANAAERPVARMASGRHRHALLSEKLVVRQDSGSKRITSVAALKKGAVWTIFVSQSASGVSRTAYARGSLPAGPWLTTDLPTVESDLIPNDGVTLAAVALEGEGAALLFQSHMLPGLPVRCFRITGEAKAIDAVEFVLPDAIAREARISCAISWGAYLFAYLQTSSEVWRARCTLVGLS